MPVTNYSELKTFVTTTMMTRPDLAGQAGDYISLAEAALNRELGPIEVDTALTGTVGSRSIDISGLSIVAPIALFLADTGRDEVELTMQADGTFPYRVNNGYPRFWAIDGTNIDFDCPLDSAYPFRFRYRERFALSDDAPTNWLLTYHPDLYVAAVAVWGGIQMQDDTIAARWATVLNSTLPSVRNIIAQSKRGTLTVDPALQRRRYYWWNGMVQ